MKTKFFVVSLCFKHGIVVIKFKKNTYLIKFKNFWIKYIYKVIFKFLHSFSDIK